MLPLTSVETNTKVTVATIHTKEDSLINKLAALGVTIGCSFFLEQKFPSYIIKVGRSRAAFDKNIAEKIYVYISV